MIGARNLSDEEIKTLSSVLNTRDKCLLIFGVRTGFRIGEALSLNVIDVFDGKTVRDAVRVSKSNMKGKNKSRIVPLHQDVKNIIEEYLKENPVRSLEYPLFRTNPVRRMDMSTFHKALKKACVKSGINPQRVSSHALRKSYAHRMNKEFSGNIYKLQLAMGHKSISSTAKYISVNEEEIWDAIKNAK